MEAYARFLNWLRILALFTSIFLAEVLLETIRSSMDQVWAVLLAGALGIASMHLLELVGESAFSRSSLIRRLILGRSYIEGIWIDRVVTHNRFGIAVISIDDGKCRVSGQQFHPDGRITATWDSYFASYESGTLRSIYRSPQFIKAVPTEIQGFSILVFQGIKHAPLTYSGFFADTSTDGRSCQIEGFKVTDKKSLKRLSNPVERRAELLSLIAVFDQVKVALDGHVG